MREEYDFTNARKNPFAGGCLVFSCVVQVIYN